MKQEVLRRFLLPSINVKICTPLGNKKCCCCTVAATAAVKSNVNAREMEKIN